MMALPAALAVTVPPETVATLLLVVVQLTALFSALSGVTVAVRGAVSPAVSARLVWLSVTLWTRMASAVAVMMIFPVTAARFTVLLVTVTALPPMVQETLLIW